MASTYTPNLNLEKPGPGDHVGAWDEVLHTNFALVDAAAWLGPVRTDDPASPADGEQWVRSDLGQLRVRVGETTRKVDLEAV